jgi:hypothetical protein
MTMIVEILVGLSLALNVSVNKQVQDRLGATETRLPAHMSAREKDAAMRPLVRSATECVARTVFSDARFAERIATLDINDLIVDSMTSCAGAMRTMIDAHDRVFGIGTGEMFFSGPYLDVLPAAVHKMLTDGASRSRP